MTVADTSVRYLVTPTGDMYQQAIGWALNAQASGMNRYLFIAPQPHAPQLYKPGWLWFGRARGEWF